MKDIHSFKNIGERPPPQPVESAFNYTIEGNDNVIKDPAEQEAKAAQEERGPNQPSKKKETNRTNSSIVPNPAYRPPAPAKAHAKKVSP